MPSRMQLSHPTAPRRSSPGYTALPPARLSAGLRCRTTNPSDEDGWDEHKFVVVGKGRWCSEGKKIAFGELGSENLGFV